MPASSHAPWRPQFHYTPRRHWMNDPNGLVFYEGEWHLFYQYNPQGDQWGHIGWGHAVSRDLLRWEERPLALPEHGGAMCFSGSAVVDWQNTSGFGQAGQPPLVAIYTAAHGGERQEQSLAYSRDRGRTWAFHAHNPVLDLGLKDFRDPKVFWHAPTQRWVMVVAMPHERQVRFYASPDLKQWTLAGHFGPAGATGGIWECPDLFPLPVEGEPGQERWALVVSLNPGGVAGGSGCQYFVGGFDGRHFTPDLPDPPPAWADFGPDFYAPVTWSDVPAADGRRILLGWMSNWDYSRDVPTAPWRGAMSLPRALSLRRVPEGWRLVQRPVAEISARRAAPARRFPGGTFAQAAAWLAEQQNLAAQLDLEITLSDLPAAGRFTLTLHTGDGEQTVLECDPAAGRLTLDRTRSGRTDFHPGFGGRYTAPLRAEGGRCTLRLLLDACSLEVFAQDGETVLTSLLFPAGFLRRWSLAAPGAASPAAVEITIHDLAPRVP